MTAAGRWLVTGGAGFIGANLAGALLAGGAQVVVLDDLSSGERSRIDRLGASGGGRLRFVEASILDAGALADAIRGASVVVNLAAQVSVAASVERPAETHAVNVEGFRAVLRACAGAGVRRILYASSAAVYGNQSGGPVNEDATPAPSSPYAESKLANEIDARAHAEANPGVAVTGLRFFNIYGPLQRAGGGYASVIPAWLQAIARGRPPVVHGDGGQTRDFCHVEDAIAAMRALASRASVTGARVYNIGSGRAVTLLELLEEMGRASAAAGVPMLPPAFEGVRAGDIRHSACRIDRARAEFGYAPAVALGDGLRQLIAAGGTAVVPGA